MVFCYHDAIYCIPKQVNDAVQFPFSTSVNEVNVTWIELRYTSIHYVAFSGLLHLYSSRLFTDIQVDICSVDDLSAEETSRNVADV